MITPAAQHAWSTHIRAVAPGAALALIVGGTALELQRLLPAGQVASPAAQRAQRFLQPDEQRLGRKELDPRGGKLNRKRQAVDSFADAGDRWRILVRGLEIRFDRHGALDKEPDGLELREGRQIR